MPSGVAHKLCQFGHRGERTQQRDVVSALQAPILVHSGCTASVLVESDCLRECYALSLRVQVVEKEQIRAKFVVNAAGGFSDKIAKMVGDDSFEIKPRLGEYVLLKKSRRMLALIDTTM